MSMSCAKHFLMSFPANAKYVSLAMFSCLFDSGFPLGCFTVECFVGLGTELELGCDDK